MHIPVSTAGQLSGTMSRVLATDTMNLPLFSVSPSGLPNTEFVALHQNRMADDGMGPVLLASDTIGRFVPADFGLTTCDELCVVPFSYDLSQLKTVVDSLFGAYYLPPTITCCDAVDNFLPGLCDTLASKGIASGNDVNSLNDVMTVMGVFAGTSGGTFSLQNFVQTIDLLNQSLALFAGCAGGITEICYAVADSLPAMDCYTIVEPLSSNFVAAAPDTVLLATNSSTQLSAYYLPNASSDSLTWYVSGGNGNITVDAVTGLVSAGSGADTAWVVALAVRGCAKDSTLVVVDPALFNQVLGGDEYFLNAFPNPFSDELNLVLNVPAGEYTIVLTDILGQVVFSSSEFFTKGGQRFNLRLGDASNGIYILQVNNAKDVHLIQKVYRKN